MTAHNEPLAISVSEALKAVRFLPDRTPNTTEDEAAGAFGELSPFDNGGIGVGHWSGNSEWERHPMGDEIVLIIGGSTTIFFLTDDGEKSALLKPGELVVVPQGVWHRFETPSEVKLLSVTPQPSDHSAVRPNLSI